MLLITPIIPIFTDFIAFFGLTLTKFLQCPVGPSLYGLLLEKSGFANRCWAFLLFFYDKTLNFASMLLFPLVLSKWKSPRLESRTSSVPFPCIMFSHSGKIYFSLFWRSKLTIHYNSYFLIFYCNLFILSFFFTPCL